jgi:hypothetical protein
MGAELVGIMLLGPQRLDAPGDVKRKAIRTVTEFVAIAQGMREVTNFAVNQHLGHDVERILELAVTTIEHLVPPCLVEEQDLSWVDQYANEGAWALVDDLICVWNNGRADSMSKGLPDGTKVVCAGEMSWGDSPNGLAYTTLRRAEMAGLFPLFGIR